MSGSSSRPVRPCGTVSSPTASSTPSWCSAAAATGDSRASTTTPEEERRELRAFYAATRRGMTATLAHQVRGRETRHALAAGGRARHRRADPRRRPAAPDRGRPPRVRGNARTAGPRPAPRLAASQPPLPAAAPRRPRRLPRPLSRGAGATPLPSSPHCASCASAGPAASPPRTTPRCWPWSHRPRRSAMRSPRRRRNSRSSPTPQSSHPTSSGPAVVLVGSLVRAEVADEELTAALQRRRSDRPTVYVSLGTFLSARRGRAPSRRCTGSTRTP